jgi:hypothetical protein
MITTIIAILGAVTGCLSLVLQFASFWLDRSRLRVAFELTTSTAQKPQLQLKVVLTNTGRRPVRILTIGIDIPESSIPASVTQKYKVITMRRALYDSRNQPMIVLEEHARKELVYPGIDLTDLRASAGERVRGVVVDTLDRVHTALFYLPSKEDIDAAS